MKPMHRRFAPVFQNSSPWNEQVPNPAEEKKVKGRKKEKDFSLSESKNAG